jgi:hemoglobin-like flavoprotein
MEKVKRDYEGYIEEAAMKNIFLLMFERIQAKHNSMEISKEQYNEIRPARALIKPT